MNKNEKYEYQKNENKKTLDKEIFSLLLLLCEVFKGTHPMCILENKSD